MFSIILMGKRELVALLCLSTWCLVIVVWLFLMTPRFRLQFVIVVFPDQNYSSLTFEFIGNPKIIGIHGTITKISKYEYCFTLD